MSFKNISGESKSVTILSCYLVENIFNADEFGLFYQCLPIKPLHLKGEKCSGGKHSKIRLIGLAAGNAYGERLLRQERLWRDSLKRPITQDILKTLEIYPCRYRAQCKSWMTIHFEE